MKRLCVRICVLTVAFLVASPLFVRADRVVLKDGNVFDGDIIRRTDKEVTIRGKFGLITFSLKRVEKVRENGTTWVPDTSLPAPVEKSADDTSSNQPPPITTPVVRSRRQIEERLQELKVELTARLQEIEASPLDTWERRRKELVVGEIGGAYRFEKPDGSYEFGQGLPKEQLGFQNAWVCERDKSSTKSDPVHHWVPLYWNSVSSRWLRSPPNYSFFRWEQAQVERMLDSIVEVADPDLPVRVVMLMDAALHADSKAKRQKKLRELESVAKRAAGNWNGDGLLYDVFLTNLKIIKSDVQAKVDLAQNRRELLAELVAKLPGQPEVEPRPLVDVDEAPEDAPAEAETDVAADAAADPEVEAAADDAPKPEVEPKPEAELGN